MPVFPLTGAFFAAALANDVLPDPNIAPLVQPEPVEVPQPSVRVLYTGGAGGVGSGHPPVELIGRLERALVNSGVSVQHIAVTHGVVVQGGHLLRVDNTMAGIAQFFDGTDVTCDRQGSHWVVNGSWGHLHLEVTGDKQPAWLSSVGPGQPVQTLVCTNGTQKTATVTSLPDSPPPSWDLAAWETRPSMLGELTGSGHTSPFVAVGAPIGETARTVAAAIDQVSDDTVPTLYVDAGDFLDGASSVRDHAPSLHRPTGLAALQRLAPAALVPGHNELVAGARSFITEQAAFELPYIATNWSTQAADLILPPYQVVEVAVEGGPPIHIAFIGILDPSLMVDLPTLGHDGVSITDPITAVQPIVAHIEQLVPRPAAIIALTTASGAVQERVRRELRGVDLLVGDPTFATLRTEQRQVQLRQLTSEQKGSALTLPMDGLTLATLTFADDNALDMVQVSPLLIGAGQAPDPEVMAAIGRVRAEVYPQLEAPLVGPPGEDPFDTWTDVSWNQFICEAVRTGSKADIALLDHLPPPPPLPGPLTELAVLDHLAILDTLEVHHVPGTQIQRLADRSEGSVPIACGITPGAKVSRIGPRWLEADRVYQIVTTSQAAEATAIGEILSSLRSTRVLDQPGVRPVLSAEAQDQPATLRSVAIDRLQQVRDSPSDAGPPIGPDGVAQAILIDGPSSWAPLWLLRVRGIGLQSQSFQGVDDPAFATVPETLATSPSSFTLGSVADVAFEFSGPSLWSDIRTQAAFTRLRAGEEDPEEIADDLLLSTSHSLPGAAFPALPLLQMMPYTEVAYDSEFTPIEEIDGGTGIAQSDLSWTVGLAALRQGPIRSLRLGGFVNRDMARLDEKPPEFGGRLDWETWQGFGPSVQWTTTAALLVFADTADDDASDLRFRALGDTRLLLPLAGALKLGLYGQVFALQGRTETNDRIAASTTLGVTLDVVGAFAL